MLQEKTGRSKWECDIVAADLMSQYSDNRLSRPGQYNPENWTEVGRQQAVNYCNDVLIAYDEYNKPRRRGWLLR